MQNLVISALGIPSGSSVAGVSLPIFLLRRCFTLPQKLSFKGCLVLFLGFLVVFFSVLLFAIRFYRILLCKFSGKKNKRGCY